jgi:hypothetical protein
VASRFSTHGFHKFKYGKPEFHLYSDEIRHLESYAYRLRNSGRVDENGEPVIWMRNGKAIIKGVGVRTNGVVTIEASYASLEAGINRGNAVRPA